MIPRIEGGSVALIESHATHAASEPSPTERLLAATGAEIQRYSRPGELLLAAAREAKPLMTVLDEEFLAPQEPAWVRRLLSAGHGPVVISASGGDDVALGRALDAGALDFFRTARMAERPGRLGQVLQQVLTRHSLRTQAVRARSGQDGDEDMRAPDALEDFVRDCVREFCTPLTIVREFAGLLEDGVAGELSERQGEYVGHVREASESLYEMLGAFRESVRHRRVGLACAPRTCSIPEAFEAAATPLAQRFDRKAVDTQIEASPGARDAWVDPGHLRRLVNLLLQRALRATPSGGEVRLWSRPEGEDRVRIGTDDGGPAPTASDATILREGALDDPIHRRSIAAVFGVGMDLARALARLNFGELEFAPIAADGGSRGARLSIVLPAAAPLALPQDGIGAVA